MNMRNEGQERAKKAGVGDDFCNQEGERKKADCEGLKRRLGNARESVAVAAVVVDDA